MSDTRYIKLFLNWYEIKGNKLVGEEVIQNMTEDDILNLFSTPFWNNIYHVWSVNSAHLKTLRRNVTHQIDTKKFSYFVEIYKISSARTAPSADY